MAEAGGVAQWTRVTDTKGTSLDEAALLRTSDGILHVVWLRHGTAVGEDDILHTRIGATGTVGSSIDIESHWSGVADPDIVATPDGGMRVLFGGIRSGAGDPNDNLNISTAPMAGEPWTLMPDTVAEADNAYASDTEAGIASCHEPDSFSHRIQLPSGCGGTQDLRILVGGLPLT